MESAAENIPPMVLRKQESGKGEMVG